MPGLLVGARQRKAILDELGRILQSPHFRTSRRSQQFLQYVVEQTLDGHEDRLKERIIGMALFHRAPDYDTGEDAAVRVAANEVRKRLAQYYVATAPLEVRIELPPGSYHPEFIWTSPLGEEAPESPPPVVRKRRWALAVAVVLLVAAALLFLWSAPPLEETAFEKFWGPLLQTRGPVLICVAHPIVYLLANPLPALPPAGAAGPAPPGDPLDLKRRGLIESPDQYVGVGDAYATARFAALFAGRNKPFQIRIGYEVSFTDLRESAAVLIGAYSNRWTMQMNTEYRFAFAEYSILDRQQPGRVWRVDMRPGYRSDEDYVLVSRILNGYSGQPLVMAAGITHAGTQAAGELLTNPAALEEAMRGAPRDWPRKNLQLILHCKVVGTTPSPPRVAASHYW